MLKLLNCIRTHLVDMGHLGCVMRWRWSVVTDSEEHSNACAAFVRGPLRRRNIEIRIKNIFWDYGEFIPFIPNKHGLCRIKSTLFQVYCCFLSCQCQSGVSNWKLFVFSDSPTASFQRIEMGEKLTKFKLNRNEIEEKDNRLECTFCNRMQKK